MNLWDKDDFTQHNQVDVDFNKGLEDLTAKDFPNEEDVVGGEYYTIEPNSNIKIGLR